MSATTQRWCTTSNRLRPGDTAAARLAPRPPGDTSRAYTPSESGRAF
jgi:hypothetical protein